MAPLPLVMFRWLTGFILLPPPQAQMQADEKFVAEQLPAIVAGLLRVTGVQEDELGAASSSAAAPAPADDGGLAFDMFAAQQRPQGPLPSGQKPRFETLRTNGFRSRHFRLGDGASYSESSVIE